MYIRILSLFNLWWVVLDFLHDLKSPRNLPLFSFFQYLFSWFRYQRQPLSVFVGKVYIEKWRMSIECHKFCSSKYFFSTYWTLVCTDDSKYFLVNTSKFARFIQGGWLRLGAFYLVIPRDIFPKIFYSSNHLYTVEK